MIVFKEDVRVPDVEAVLPAEFVGLESRPAGDDDIVFFHHDSSATVTAPPPTVPSGDDDRGQRPLQVRAEAVHALQNVDPAIGSICNVHPE